MKKKHNSKTKHILLIFPHYRRSNEYGGQRSRYVAEGLLKAGFKITVLIPGVDSMTGIRHGSIKGHIWSKESDKGIEIYRANSTNNDRTSFLRRILYMLTSNFNQIVASTNIKNVDLVICTSLPITLILLSYILCKVRRMRYIAEVRDIGINVAVEAGYINNSLIIKMVNKLETFLYKSADQVIVVSEGFRELLIDRGVQVNRISVIPLGYDGYLHGDSKINLDDMELLNNKFIVFYAGTLGHVININLMLDAASILRERKDIMFVIIGEGQKLIEYRNKVFIEGLNCKLLGSKPKSLVGKYCAQADVCVYPAKEGVNINAMLGNKIFDYLGSGTPVIYSGPGGDVCTLIKSSNGGVCVEGKAEKLAEAILLLYDKDDIRQSMGVSAKKYIYENYKCTVMADTYTKIVEEFVKI